MRAPSWQRLNPPLPLPPNPTDEEPIGRTIRALKEEGFTILLVEQNFRFASTVADRYYVMENGRVAESFASAELNENLEKLHEYLGV